MNRVGGENGESVWLGMFLCEVLRLFAPLCEPSDTRRLLDRRSALLASLDRYAWDGGWYLRAWYDDGSRLGSAASEECRIDLLPQAWGVMCGVSRDRCAMAMGQRLAHALRAGCGPDKALYPALSGAGATRLHRGLSARRAGKRRTVYPTPPAGPWPPCISWGRMAAPGNWPRPCCPSAMPPRASWPCATAWSPMRWPRTYTPIPSSADAAAGPWYTGSASWLQYVVLTQLLGFQKTGNVLRFRPVAPSGWDELRVTYRFGTATYHLHASRECPLPHRGRRAAARRTADSHRRRTHP